MRTCGEAIQSPGLSLVFSADEAESACREGSLLSLDIELTKRCNLRCVYCYVAASERQKDELRLNEVIRIIDEAKQLGVRVLNLTGGEPLLDERYFKIARYARELGIAVLLFTNGTLITEKVAGKLMDLRISPCVKLDALSPTVQDYLVGKKGVLNRIKDGISHLIRVGYTTKYPVLSINAVACRKNLNEIPEVWTWARERNIVPFLTRLQPMGRAQRRTALTLTSEELYSLFCKISEIDKEFSIVWEPNIPWVYGKACRRHYVGCFIDSHGNVQPCSGVPIKAGNIRERGLAEILSSSKIFEVARNVDSHIEDACRSCKYKSECYGCRSIAYFMRGSFTAADPLCWHNQEGAAVKRWDEDGHKLWCLVESAKVAGGDLS
jgi:radical SAM protein with 4Fe4S-binding SPASM domain